MLCTLPVSMLFADSANGKFGERPDFWIHMATADSSRRGKDQSRVVERPIFKVSASKTCRAYMGKDPVKHGNRMAGTCVRRHGARLGATAERQALAACPFDFS